MSGLNIDEPKLSSMLTLRVELKERKCEIRLFKVCSSKLTITSVVALGPLHDKIRLSPRVLPRRKVPDQKGNEMTSRSNVRESA